jgi:hypothetical protein
MRLIGIVLAALLFTGTASATPFIQGESKLIRAPYCATAAQMQAVIEANVKGKNFGAGLKTYQETEGCNFISLGVVTFLKQVYKNENYYGSDGKQYTVYILKVRWRDTEVYILSSYPLRPLKKPEKPA